MTIEEAEVVYFAHQAGVFKGTHSELAMAVLLLKQLDCEHVWGIDGAHSNVYCKKCFMSKPDQAL